MWNLHMQFLHSAYSWNLFKRTLIINSTLYIVMLLHIYFVQQIISFERIRSPAFCILKTTKAAQMNSLTEEQNTWKIFTWSESRNILCIVWPNTQVLKVSSFYYKKVMKLYKFPFYRMFTSYIASIESDKFAMPNTSFFAGNNEFCAIFNEV